MDKVLVDFAALVARDLARREAYGTALLPLLCELTDLRTSLHRHAVTPLPLPLLLALPLIPGDLSPTLTSTHSKP